MKKHLYRLAVLCVAVLAAAAFTEAAYSQEAGSASRKARIVLVDSYHRGYPWSDGLEKGVREALEPSGTELKVLRLDSKRNPSLEQMKEAGARAMQEIKRFKPDVVIAADDNAQRFLVVPYLLDTETPVVFCGVNWDASVYGYPAKNVTGMVEVESVEAMVALFKRDAKGDRMGYVSGDTVSDRKITAEFNKRFFNGGMKTYFVKNFEEFKKVFLQAQQESDMLFLRNYSGIKGWEEEEAKRFILRNISRPTGSHLDFMAEYVIYTMGKVPEEQGEYAAKVCLRILEGESPADIPLAENKRVRLMVNLKMAKAAGVVVPFNVLKTATVIGKQ